LSFNQRDLVELILSKCEFMVKCFLVWITHIRKLVSTCNAFWKLALQSRFWICGYLIDLSLAKYKWNT